MFIFFIGLFPCLLSVTTRSLIRALLCTCGSRSLAVTVWASLGQLLGLLVLRGRTVPNFLALYFVSATIGASSCLSSPHNLIPRCAFVSGNWALGFKSPVSVLVEAGSGSNARPVLCLASELHLQQAMTSADRQERGQWSPDTSYLWLTSPLTCHPLFGLSTVRGAPVLPTWFLSVYKLPLPPPLPTPTQSKIIRILATVPKFSVLSPESQWHSWNDPRWRDRHSADYRDMVICSGWRCLYCWNDPTRLCASYNRSLEQLRGAEALTSFFRTHSVTVHQTPVHSVFFEAFELHISGKNLSVSVSCLRRPLLSRKNKLSSQLFLQEFPEFLTQFADSHSDVVLLGDFNFHCYDCADTQVNRLKNMLSDHDLSQLVEVHTRWCGHTVDWVVVRSDVSCLVLERVEDMPGLSDHKSLLWQLDDDHTTKQGKAN